MKSSSHPVLLKCKLLPIRLKCCLSWERTECTEGIWETVVCTSGGLKPFTVNRLHILYKKRQVCYVTLDPFSRSYISFLALKEV